MNKTIILPRQARDKHRESSTQKEIVSFLQVNGVPSCSSTELLTNLTRNTWNFSGIWVSDCGAIADIYDTHNYTKTGVATVKAALDAGLDLNCGNFLDEYLGKETPFLRHS